MAIKSLADLQSAWKSPERNTEGTSMPNNYYPFWNMPADSKAVVRFLPDANEENPMGFVVEKVTHVLQINGERKTVPCLSMYGDSCPICAVSQRFYKDGDNETGKKYWKKKTHIAQVLVLEDPIPAGEDGETHQGKVRYVQLGYQLFNIIKAAFDDGDLDQVPFHYEEGTNFLIKKTKQGDYDNYTTSKFDRKPTALTSDQVELADAQRVDLSTLLPKHPGVEKVEAMLEAALSGGTYEEETPSKKGPAMDKADTSVTASVKAALSSSDDKEEVDAEAEADAEDLLAQIRNRRKKKGE